MSGGSSVQGDHDQMNTRCGFYSKRGYCGEVEEFGGSLGEGGGGGGSFPPAAPVDETLTAWCTNVSYGKLSTDQPAAWRFHTSSVQLL